MTRRIDTVEVAKMVRRELKARWPTVKFSVTSDRYSGGSSIDVSWFDGPNTDAVEQVVGRFHGATFDGMIDLKSYHDSVLGDEIVSFGNDFIFCHRRESDWDTLVTEAARIIRAGCATEGAPPYDLFGGQWVRNLAEAMVHDLDFTKIETLYQAFRRVVLREHDDPDDIDAAQAYAEQRESH